MQVGLPDEFLHQMWGLCNDARAQVTERVWLDINGSDQPPSKARVRELTYRALPSSRLQSSRVLKNYLSGLKL
jgi:hypothetical protein